MDKIRYFEIPKEIQEDLVMNIANYSLGFFRAANISQGKDFGLLGSGTLVTFRGKTGHPVHAILTAHHVIEALPKTGNINFALGTGSTPTAQYPVDGFPLSGMRYVEIARWTQDTALEGPDLGAIVLSPSIADGLRAKKSFVDLDRQREIFPTNIPSPIDGIWVLQGLLAERSQLLFDEHGPLNRFYWWSSIGQPAALETANNFDYFEMVHNKQDKLPKSYEGMSGGGLWLFPHDPKEKMNLALGAPFFCGVIFCQKFNQLETVIRCHGPNSCHNAARNVIIDAISR